MRAWQMQRLGDPWQDLTAVTVDAPVVDEHSLQIDVHATDLNFADILQCQGTYQVRLEPPFTPGMFSAGVVTALGSATQGRWQVGDRVIGPTLGTAGGYAEKALIHADQAHAIPQGVTAVASSAMHVTYGTAWFALHRRGHLQPGETVLVLAAAGGVGSAAVQLAKEHGCWVIAAARGVEKLDACRSLGADEVLDYASEDMYARVMTLTDGRGVDVVYDPVGGEYFDIARRLLAWEGRLLVIGFAGGNIPSAPANHVLVKNYSVVGVHMGGYRDKDPTPFQQCYTELNQMLIDGRIDPLIDAVIGFDQLPATLQKLANRQTKGRVVFDPRR